MLVFWWQGRGFVTALILVATTILVGMTADALDMPSYTAWFWAAVLALAALVNWFAGRRLNAKRRKSLGILSPWKSLTYRARHKFTSLPMESWSILFLIAASACAIRGMSGA